METENKLPKILCLIPARGGSKFIPRKNIKTLVDRPLIAYTIKQAKEIGLIGRVVVSTDDEEIADVAREWGAEVPFLRPKDLAQDFTPDLPVFEDALRWLKEKEGYQPEFIVHLRCTVPLRKTSDIKIGVNKMVEFKPDAVISVSLVREFPQKMWRIIEGRAIKLLPSELQIKGGPESPRQLLEPIYRQNGVVDVIKYETIMVKKSMFGDYTLPLITDQEDAIDIDTPMDFILVESIIKKRRGL
jgi:CMP-N-acetylneuraminic acid synthetase